MPRPPSSSSFSTSLNDVQRKNNTNPRRFRFTIHLLLFSLSPRLFPFSPPPRFSFARHRLDCVFPAAASARRETAGYSNRVPLQRPVSRSVLDYANVAFTIAEDPSPEKFCSLPRAAFQMSHRVYACVCAFRFLSSIGKEDRSCFSTRVKRARF